MLNEYSFLKYAIQIYSVPDWVRVYRDLWNPDILLDSCNIQNGELPHHTHCFMRGTFVMIYANYGGDIIESKV